MNERVKELAEQAGLYFYVNGKLYPQELSAEESIVAYDRFAELIIGECVDAAFANGDDIAYIKKHFGIEE